MEERKFEMKSFKKLYRVWLSDPDGEMFLIDEFADTAQGAVDAARRVHDESTVFCVAEVVLDWV